MPSTTARLAPVPLGRRTAALATITASITTVQQAVLLITAFARRGCIAVSIVSLVLAATVELRLDGRRVNAIFMQTLTNGGCQLHVSLRALGAEVEVDSDVEGGDELGVGELPDMEVVAGLDTGQVLDIIADVVDFNAVRHGLEENAGCGFAERDGRAENDDCDNKRNGRVEVEAAREFREPDNQCCCDDTNVAEGIAHDVEEDALHVEIAVRVTMSSTGSALARFRVVVFGVVDGLSRD